MTTRDTTPLGGNVTTGCAALEVSGSSWVHANSLGQAVAIRWAFH